MPPIVLKLEGNESRLPFSNFNQDELSKTWRVCTKVKDALENGSRLENLSWRLWFIQNVLVSNDVKLSSDNIPSSSGLNKQQESIISPPSTQQMEEEETELVLDYSNQVVNKPTSNHNMTNATENFILNQFTSDQQGDQMIELKDIFPFDYMYSIPDEDPSLAQNQFNFTNNHWQPDPTMNNRFYPATTQFDQNYTQSSFMPDYNNTSAINIPVDNTDLLNQPINFFADYNSTAAFTAIPNATLHNKLLATLPRQTLASAERLLLCPKKPPPPPTIQQQQRMSDAMPITTTMKKNQRNNQHYYNTFQLDTPIIKPPENIQTNTANTTSSVQNDKSLQCSNCDATTTPLWRRSAQDEILCNACGL